MTVVMALACEDGVVMGADTQITDKGRGMSYPGRKLHTLGDHAAWGGSGARAVQIDLQKAFGESADAVLAADDIGRAIQAEVLPILRYHYEHFIEDVPGESGGGTPSAYVLAAGMDGDRPWIVEVEPHGMVGRYEDLGFHAVGSGAAQAQQAGTLLAHFQMHERPVDYGVVAVVRVLEALKTTSPSIGGEIDVIRVTEDDGAHDLTDDELAEAREHVARWCDLEQKALDDLFR